jgi:hypothetical protein
LETLVPLHLATGEMPILTDRTVVAEFARLVDWNGIGRNIPEADYLLGPLVF